MILVFILSLTLDNKIDSLRNLVEKNPELSSIIELNMCYFLTEKESLGIELLKKYYNRLKADDNISIVLHLADDYLYTGQILNARKEYLKLVNRYPGSEYANDALEKLYMIESARRDTLMFKALGYSIFLYNTDQLHTAVESLKNLVKTRLGEYALYYLALTYLKLDDIPQALGALDDLTSSFPDHKIHNAILLKAQMYIDLNRIKEARTILEELIVRAPNSIYAVKARGILETKL